LQHACLTNLACLRAVLFDVRPPALAFCHLLFAFEHRPFVFASLKALWRSAKPYPQGQLKAERTSGRVEGLIWSTRNCVHSCQITCDQMGSLGLTWSHWVSPGLTGNQLESLGPPGVAGLHLVSRSLTWLHFVSVGFLWSCLVSHRSHSNPPGLACLTCAHLGLLRITRICYSTQGRREDIPWQNGEEQEH
jgi:hypothetical protein